MFKILDCTLRDGGYYTNWDFSPEVIDAYIQAMNQLPIDYLEIGYRNIPSKVYLGKLGYSPVSVLRHLRAMCAKKLVVMLNEKDVRSTNLKYLLIPIQGLVDMVRLCISSRCAQSLSSSALLSSSSAVNLFLPLFFLSPQYFDNAYPI